MSVTWKIADRELSLDNVLVMGILNVTPDSFSDGGSHNTLEKALQKAREMREQGADIIDVGGESTRPGAAIVTVEEELARVVPVVKALVSEGFIVSVDTSKPEVMRESIAAGAQIINDIRAFTEPGAVEAVAGTGAGLVIMHMQGTPQTMQDAPSYKNVNEEVVAFLKDREKVLMDAGVPFEAICWDCGFGFGKTVEQNFEMLAEQKLFAKENPRVLLGLSRKSSIGAATGVAKASERVVGSVAGALLGVVTGANVVRVHDVKETVEALNVWRSCRVTL